MHLIVSLFVILSVWLWGDWRNWQKYHTVMLYFALGNLAYNFLTANYFLWRLDADAFSNRTFTEVLYTFSVFPGTALLFVGNYPKNLGKSKIISHYLFYIGWYAGIEFLYVHFNRIDYQYGWNYWWSVGFDIIMFPMLWLFYRKPLIAYPLSILFAIFFLWWFDIPVGVPVENRNHLDCLTYLFCE
ncbi:CBO0543 family protein [Bacillaceae bacterium S4-13-58]